MTPIDRSRYQSMHIIWRVVLRGRGQDFPAAAIC